MKKTESKGYEATIGSCRTHMRLFGLWPDPFIETDWFMYFRALVTILVLLFFGTFTQTIKIIQVWGNLNEVIGIFMCSQVTSTTAVLKIIGVWYYRNVLRDLIHQILDDWQYSHIIEEQAIMQSNAKFIKFIVGTTLYLGNATFVAYTTMVFLQIIAFSKSITNRNETVEWPLFAVSWFPYDAQITPNYELTIVGQIFTSFFSAISYTSIDSLFILLVMHLCGQLSVLKLTVLNFDSHYKEGGNDFIETLAFVLQRHEQLTRFGFNIEEIFNKTFFVQVISSSVILCLLGYQVVTSLGHGGPPIAEIIFLVYYVLCFLFITFTYCYVAEKLREKSLDIGDAVYNCKWFDLPYIQARQLVIIIMRAHRPLKMTVGKFVAFSLELYCSILKTSGGYISMLLVIQERMIEQN